VIKISKAYYKMNFDNVRCPFCDGSLYKEDDEEEIYLISQCCAIKTFSSKSKKEISFYKFVTHINDNIVMWWSVYLDEENKINIRSSRDYGLLTTEISDLDSHKKITINIYIDLDFDNVIESAKSVMFKVKNLEAFQ
jgi:hypothetical protein